MFTRKQGIGIIGVPSDLGANIPGSRLGPDAIRIAGVHRHLQSLGYKTEDKGNLDVPRRFYGQNGSYNYLEEITDINQNLFLTCQEVISNDMIPLTLGGDHSIAIGTVAASADFFPNLGLVWVDTHADINNPDSSETKNIHGMPVSTLLHSGFPSLVQIVRKKLDPKNMVIIGLRDVDPAERTILSQSGIQYYTMRHIDELGVQGMFRLVQEKLLNRVDHLHVSFDLDVMDPKIAPGVSTPVEGGLNLREAHLLLELLHESKKVRACDFVELNPMHDIKGISTKHSVSLIGSLFGSRII